MLAPIYIETERLLAFPLTYQQLSVYLEKSPFFEELMGLQPSAIAITEEVAELFSEAILPRLMTETTSFFWFTNWVVILKEDKKAIGDFCFYDFPDEQGLVEIGYGIYPHQQKRGYMFELMNGIIDWLRKQEHVKFIRARTEKTNIPSVSLLTKSGFECPNYAEEIQFWYYVL